MPWAFILSIFFAVAAAAAPERSAIPEDLDAALAALDEFPPDADKVTFKSTAPEDMSGIILRSFWRRLNGRPLEVEAQASCDQRWWQEYARLKKDAQSRGAGSYSPPDFEC